MDYGKKLLILIWHVQRDYLALYYYRVIVLSEMNWDIGKFVWKKTLKFLKNGMLRVSYLLMIFLQQVWKDSKK